MADWCPTLTQRQADKRQRQCGSASTGRALQAGAGGRRPPAAGRGGRDEAETISRWAPIRAAEPLGAAEPGPVKCRQKRRRGTVSRESCFSRCRELKSQNLRSLSQSRPPLPSPSPPRWLCMLRSLPHLPPPSKLALSISWEGMSSDSRHWKTSEQKTSGSACERFVSGKLRDRLSQCSHVLRAAPRPNQAQKTHIRCDL